MTSVCSFLPRQLADFPFLLAECCAEITTYRFSGHRGNFFATIAGKSSSGGAGKAAAARRERRFCSPETLIRGRHAMNRDRGRARERG
jgi:hypothetical protein